MKRIWKKNQIIITALVIMIAVAGYLNYTQSTVDKLDESKDMADNVPDDSLESLAEDAVEESMSQTALDEMGKDVFTNEEEDTYELSDSTEEVTTVEVSDTGELALTEGEGGSGEAVLVSNFIDSDYFSSAKLAREQNRAKNKEVLMKLVNDESASKKQKKEAMDGILAMTEISEKENAAEMLLESKGFSDVVVSMSDESVDVIVNATELSVQQMAQIEDIVKRKTGVEASKVVINPVAVKE